MVATIATIVAPTGAAVYQVLLGQAGGSCVKHKGGSPSLLGSGGQINEK